MDEAITFYQALGFERTYRQLKPNPYAVVKREDLRVHLCGIDGFDPEQSYGSVIVVVPDPDALYRAFAAGLRAAYGKLPVKGIPRITRPRKRYGTVYGFSVVDVGGNWLRVSRAGEAEADDAEVGEKADGLAGIVLVAARLGDAHGDDAKALKILESGMGRFSDAPALDRARALLYRAELAVRVGDEELAHSSLAAVRSLELSGEERAAIAAELAQASELVKEGQRIEATGEAIDDSLSTAETTTGNGRTVEAIPRDLVREELSRAQRPAAGRPLPAGLTGGHGRRAGAAERRHLPVAKRGTFGNILSMTTR
ncbi:VOC family protein [Sorangium sp. So ce1128]